MPSERHNAHAGRPWYVALVGLYPVLSLYAHNVQVVSPVLALRALVAVPAGAVLLWLVAWLLRRDLHRSAMMSAVITLALFGWGHFVRMAVPANLIFYKTRFFAGYAGALAVFVLYLWRRKAGFASWTAALNVAGMVLVALPIVSILRSPTFYSNIRAECQALRPSEAPREAPAGGSPTDPDIYFIVLDAYPRRDVLSDHYGFVNDEFLGWLESNGFSVAHSSRSNYSKSLWSLASCFNMQYLDELLPDQHADDVNLHPLLAAFRHNQLFALLRERGYAIVAFATGFDYLELDRDADVYLSPGMAGNEFEVMLLQMTPIPRMMAQLSGSEYQFEQHRQRIRFTFDQLAAFPSRVRTQPVFVYAHVVAPHEPIVFGAGGEPVCLEDVFILGAGRPDWISPRAYAEAYVEQVKYVNRQTIQALARILEVSRRDAVLAVVSDHGLLNPPNGDARLQVKNLITLRIPPQKGTAEPAARVTSLVNLFPHILNSCFGFSLPFREEKSFLVEWERPYAYMPCEADRLVQVD